MTKLSKAIEVRLPYCTDLAQQMLRRFLFCLMACMLFGPQVLAQDALDSVKDFGAVAYRDPDKAFSMVLESRREALELGDDSLIAWTHYAEGGLWYIRADYAKSKKSLLTALGMYEDADIPTGVSDVQHVLGLIDLGLGRYEASKRRFRVALQDPTRDSLSRARVLTGFSKPYLKLGQHDSSLVLVMESIALKEGVGDSIGLSFSYGSLANLYNAMGRYSSADSAAQLAMEVAKRTKLSLNVVEILCIQAEIALKSGRSQEALRLAQMSFDSAVAQEHNIGRHAAAEVLSLANYDLGNHEEAYTYNKLYHTLKDSIFDLRSVASINALEESFHAEREWRRTLNHELEMARLESEMQKNRETIILVVAVFAVLLILCMWLLNRYRLVNRTRKAELDLHKAETKFVQQKLETKQKELLMFTLSLSRKKNALIELREMIKSDSSPKVKRLYRQINRMLGNSAEWGEFEARLMEVSPDFYSKLQELHPQLTDGDHRLGGLISLNLSSKQIAELLNIEHSSVNMARYRLRKKLGLESDQSLYLFLTNLRNEQEAQYQAS